MNSRQAGRRANGNRQAIDCVSRRENVLLTAASGSVQDESIQRPQERALTPIPRNWIVPKEVLEFVNHVRRFCPATGHPCSYPAMVLAVSSLIERATHIAEIDVIGLDRPAGLPGHGRSNRVDDAEIGSRVDAQRFFEDGRPISAYHAAIPQQRHEFLGNFFPRHLVRFLQDVNTFSEHALR